MEDIEMRGQGGAMGDLLGAFCAHGGVVAHGGMPEGPLRGLTFAVKDVFALAGHAACFGNPTWLETHAPSRVSAPVVEALRAAGGELVGVTITDELAFSLTGENSHYGTPVNPAAPDRVPGGSSAGSAAAVAGGACDFALGTDTGGSVRVPASHCGLWGFRPTHGAISDDGVLPFAPRFDTVGWFARDARILEAVGACLLPPRSGNERRPRRAVVPTDAFALADAAVRRPLAAALLAIARAPGGASIEEGTVSANDTGPLDSWLETYAVLQSAEIEREHGAWLDRCHPRFGTLIADRLASARKMARDPARVRGAEAHGERIRAHLTRLLDGDTILVLPSACGVAPARGRGDDEINEETARSLTLSAIASLGGLPQISVPALRIDGRPLGISLIAAAGQDHALLELAAHVGPDAGGGALVAAEQPRKELV